MDAYKIYKISRYMYIKKCTVFAKLFMKLNKVLNNSYIPYTAEIGEGSEFAYGGIGVVIHSDSKLGKNCMIGQGCTIGGRGEHGGPPIIGDNVYIGAGARLIGKFEIGDNVIIGANSVVIKPIPSNTVVAGCPAREIRKIDPNTTQ